MWTLFVSMDLRLHLFIMAIVENDELASQYKVISFTKSRLNSGPESFATLDTIECGHEIWIEFAWHDVASRGVGNFSSVGATCKTPVPIDTVISKKLTAL